MVLQFRRRSGGKKEKRLTILKDKETAIINLQNPREVRVGLSSRRNQREDFVTITFGTGETSSFLGDDEIRNIEDSLFRGVVEDLEIKSIPDPDPGRRR